MRTPCWDDRVAWARAEARRHVDRSLPVPVTLLLFVGDDAVAYVRADGVPGQDPRYTFTAATTFASRLAVDRVVAIHEARLSDGDEPDRAVRLATGQAAVGIEWCADGADVGANGGLLLPHRIDDHGGVEWDEEVPHDGGLLASILAAVVSAAASPLADLATADACYAISRTGVAIGVHPAWRRHLDLDAVPDPSGLRPEDRRRARDLLRGRGEVAA